MKKPAKRVSLSDTMSNVMVSASPDYSPTLEQQAGVDPGDVDGRTLRATGRTHPFATRIREDVHKTMKRIVARDGITLGELLERAVAAYEREKSRS